MKKVLSVILCILLLSGAMPVSAASSAAPSEDGGYIVKLREGGGARLLSSAGDQVTNGVVAVASREDLDGLIASGSVEYWEPDYTVEFFGAVNDTYYSRQWNLSDIGAENAWSAGITGRGVRVAVIDSGVFREHEDLRGTDILTGESVISGVTGTDDAVGHGTLVTGIIAAESNNGMGIAGIADQVTIVPIKCFASTNEANVSDICAGIYKAVDFYNCGVICLSLGTPDDSAFLHKAVDYASQHGAIVVAAVGNDGKAGYYYPAAYESVVGVGSYDSDGQVSSFSEKNDSVFISAPGGDVYSTYIGRSNSYALAGGTSFAAPHVAALAALAKSAAPSMNVTGFKELLRETCRDAGAPGYDTSYGYGKIDMTDFTAFLTDKAADASSFTDTAGHWAEDYINFCVNMGVFSGVSATRFDPDGGMTRGMLVTVLYNRDNGLHAAASSGITFSDVTDPAGQWYYDAVYWAAANGIVDGYSDGTFRPNDKITREQLCAMLHRYAGSPQPADPSALGSYSDGGTVSAYAATAAAWASSAGLVSGKGNGRLAPLAGATRAEVAAIMYRYILSA